jgi:hypothetical protein
MVAAEAKGKERGPISSIHPTSPASLVALAVLGAVGTGTGVYKLTQGQPPQQEDKKKKLQEAVVNWVIKKWDEFNDGASPAKR